MAGVKVEMREFGSLCAKCKALAGIRSWCRRCKEVPGQDHMHSACTACGFAWLEVPGDAKSEKPKKGAKR